MSSPAHAAATARRFTRSRCADQRPRSTSPMVSPDMVGRTAERSPPTGSDPDAYLYVRQSTVRQVYENTESTPGSRSARSHSAGRPRRVPFDTDLGIVRRAGPDGSPGTRSWGSGRLGLDWQARARCAPRWTISAEHADRGMGPITATSNDRPAGLNTMKLAHAPRPAASGLLNQARSGPLVPLSGTTRWTGSRSTCGSRSLRILFDTSLRASTADGLHFRRSGLSPRGARKWPARETRASSGGQAFYAFGRSRQGGRRRRAARHGKTGCRLIAWRFEAENVIYATTRWPRRDRRSGETPRRGRPAAGLALCGFP